MEVAGTANPIPLAGGRRSHVRSGSSWPRHAWAGHARAWSHRRWQVDRGVVSAPRTRGLAPCCGSACTTPRRRPRARSPHLRPSPVRAPCPCRTRRDESMVFNSRPRGAEILTPGRDQCPPRRCQDRAAAAPTTAAHTEQGDTIATRKRQFETRAVRAPTSIAKGAICVIQSRLPCQPSIRLSQGFETLLTRAPIRRRSREVRRMSRERVRTGDGRAGR